MDSLAGACWLGRNEMALQLLVEGMWHQFWARKHTFFPSWQQIAWDSGEDWSPDEQAY